MRLNIIFSFCLFLLGLLVFPGCNRSASSGDSSLKFDSVSVSKTYHILENENYPECTLNIVFNYPVEYKNKAVLENIQKLFIGSVLGDGYSTLSAEEAVNEYADSYLAEYKEIEKTFLSDLEEMKAEGADNSFFPSSYSYENNLNNWVSYNENNILSYFVCQYEYTGGAHGLTYIGGHVIDTKTGKFLMYDDIFVKGKENEITTLLVNQLKEDKNVQTDDELKEAGYDNIPGIKPTENFVIDGEGVTFIFGQYEIGPYVMGITEILLPYDKLSSYLKTDSPVFKLVKNNQK